MLPPIGMDWLTFSGWCALALVAGSAIVGFEWLRGRAEQRARMERLVRRPPRR